MHLKHRLQNGVYFLSQPQCLKPSIVWSYKDREIIPEMRQQHLYYMHKVYIRICIFLCFVIQNMMMQHQWGMSPSGHFWDQYAGALPFLSSNCNSPKDGVTVDEIYT